MVMRDYKANCSENHCCQKNITRSRHWFSEKSLELAGLHDDVVRDATTPHLHTRVIWKKKVVVGNMKAESQGMGLGRGGDWR